MTIGKIQEFGITLSRDASTQQFAQLSLQTPSDQVQILLDLERKLALGKAANGTKSETAVYSVPLERAVSDEGAFTYAREDLQRHFSFNWKFVQESPESIYFIKHIPVSHYTDNRLEAHSVLIEVRLPVDSANRLLDKYKKGSGAGPFLYSPEHDYIIGHSQFNRPLAETIVRFDLPSSSLSSGSLTREINGEKYLISYQPSSELDLILIDYAPFTEVLSPITKSNNIFYYSVLVMVFLAFIASFLFYRNVQVPVKRLVAGTRAIARGNYQMRIENDNNAEFRFLNDQFNRMAGQIEELVDSVLRSQLRLNEAQLKLLQSQIDPHFLYNSLFFIKNCARSGDEEAVVAMALNLGEYYRYSNRLDKPFSTLAEETTLLSHYCVIQNLRLERLELRMSLNEEIVNQPIPRLLLQPIVENAIVHGIEISYEPGLIVITGEKQGDNVRVVIEDNGPGMTSESLNALIASTENNTQPGESCGLWNVRQRLLLLAKQQASFSIGHSSLGGLQIELTWPFTADAKEE